MSRRGQGTDPRLERRNLALWLYTGAASLTRKAPMKKLWLLAGFLALSSAVVLTQSNDELLHDGRNPENVTTQSMGYDRKSYSPLKQINKSNVKRLVPIWSAALSNDQGELAAPTVYNGVMYVINGKWTFAIDVETGRQIWRTPVELESGAQRGAFKPGGPKASNGKLFAAP